MVEPGLGQPGLAKLGRFGLASRQVGPGQVGAGKIGVFHFSIGKDRSLHGQIHEIAFIQTGAYKPNFFHGSLFRLRGHKAGTCEVGAVKTDVFKPDINKAAAWHDCPETIGVRDGAVDKHRRSKIGFGELSAAHLGFDELHARHAGLGKITVVDNDLQGLHFIQCASGKISAGKIALGEFGGFQVRSDKTGPRGMNRPDVCLFQIGVGKIGIFKNCPCHYGERQICAFKTCAFKINLFKECPGEIYPVKIFS